MQDPIFIIFHIRESQYQDIKKISELFASMSETFSFILMKKILKEYKKDENPKINFKNLSGNDLLIQKVKLGLIQTKIGGLM